MFTGIIQEIGTIQEIQKRGGKTALTIGVTLLAKDVRIGDSIAVDGVCLTVVKHTRSDFSVEVVEESLQRTTLKYVQKGDKVNIEYSLRLSDRLGGHFVQGHVDCTGAIRCIEELEGSALYNISLPEESASICIEKGSIAIDGISLTIAVLKQNDVTISIIPHTRNHTTLGQKKVGNKVNIEVDLIGKYVKRLLEGNSKPKGITEDFLKETGFITQA